MKPYVLDANRFKTVFLINAVASDKYPAAVDAEQKLRELGYLPIQPVELFETVDELIASDILLEGMVSAMALCPIVVMLDGWEFDRLSNTLVNIARLMEKQCIHVALLTTKLKPIVDLPADTKEY